MKLLTTGSFANALAALSVVFASSYSPQPTVDERQISRRDVPEGGQCGLNNGNAACAKDLCCSEHGFCGTGANFCIGPYCQLDFGPACDGNKWPVGDDTSGVLRPRFGSVVYGAAISGCERMGKVALTFDDGPDKYTNDLLDLLKRNNVKATFFVVGANNAKGQIEDRKTGYVATIQRMFHEGHQIGSHSWSHQNFTAINARQRHEQIIKNEMALVDILGVFPTYLRPPYSSWNDEILSELYTLGYHIVDLNLDTHDWEGDYQVAQDAFSSALSQHSPTSSSFIAVSHDIDDKTVHGYVQFMIDEARKYNYELVTVGECLGDHPNNWYRDSKTGEQFGGPPPQSQDVAASTPAPSPSAPAPSAPSSSPSAQASATELGSTIAAPAVVSTPASSASKEDGPRPPSTTTSMSVGGTTASTTAAPKSSFSKRQDLSLALCLTLGGFVLLAVL